MFVHVIDNENCIINTDFRRRCDFLVCFHRCSAFDCRLSIKCIEIFGFYVLLNNSKFRLYFFCVILSSARNGSGIQVI